MDEEIFICENRNCRKEYTDPKAKWLYDGENDWGEHLWLFFRLKERSDHLFYGKTYIGR